MPSYYKILNKAEEEYFSIKSIVCPSLNNEVINFNRKGFRHFIRKNNKVRPIPDQIRRLKMIPKVIEIVGSNETVAKLNKGINYDFYSLTNDKYDIKY